MNLKTSTWLVILLACPFRAMAAEPAATPTTRPAPATTIFDDRFEGDVLSRFRTPPAEPGRQGSQAYDNELRGFALGGYTSLVRPLQAGPASTLALDLQFTPLQADRKDAVETDFSFVLFNKSVAGLKIMRAIIDGKEQCSLRFVAQGIDEKEPQLIREIRPPEPPAGVKWALEYRHGLLTLREGTRIIGRGDTRTLNVPIAGISWSQRGGRVVCRQMTLTGTAPRAFTTEEQATLQKAADLSRDAGNLMRQGRLDEALQTMRESSALYVKIHGELHPDSGNSFMNMATILEKQKAVSDALPLWKKALEIHEQTLGADHPHTATTRFNYGRSLKENGEPEKAKAQWILCRDTWLDVYGPEFPLIPLLEQRLKGM